MLFLFSPHIFCARNAEGRKNSQAAEIFALDLDAAVTIVRTLFQLFGFNWTEKREERLKRQNRER
ncbi:MAG: hypothetical protein AMJ41_02215 [candidate division Zixibacteria bacterium DG_27]|nr:MAG: hypothetical protein AMJ41_02215 [candidate division Zixibacteria bacterium DG_27]